MTQRPRRGQVWRRKGTAIDLVHVYWRRGHFVAAMVYGSKDYGVFRWEDEFVEVYEYIRTEPVPEQ
jgi:hypothetical protein